MINKGPAVPTSIATAVLGLVIGGVGGYYVKAADEKPGNNVRPQGGQAGMMGGGGGGGMMGGGGGGGMMGGGGGGRGGGAQTPTASGELTTLVRQLSTVEKVQDKGLTAEQKKTLAPILKKIQAADKLPEDQCKADVASINGALTPGQIEALKSLTPPRGGGRGGPGGGGGGMMAGMMASRMAGGPGAPRAGGGGAGTPMAAGPTGGMGAMGGGGGMGGGQGDPEKPFASERNKQALDDLISAVEK